MTLIIQKNEYEDGIPPQDVVIKFKIMSFENVMQHPYATPLCRGGQGILYHWIRFEINGIFYCQFSFLLFVFLEKMKTIFTISKSC